MKRTYPLIIILLFLFSVCPNAQGQTAGLNKGSSAQDSWQENVIGLKVYVNALVEENQQLKVTNEELVNRVEELNKTLKGALEKSPVAGSPKPDNQALKKELETLKRDKAGLEDKLESCKKEKAPKSAPCPDDKNKKSDRIIKACEQEKSIISKQLSEAGEKIKEQQKEVEQLKVAQEDLKKELSARKSPPQDQAERQLKAERDKLTEEMEGLKKQNLAATRDKEIADSLLKLQQPNAAVAAAAVATPAISGEKTNYELAGYNLAKSGKYTEAIAEYQKALQAAPQNKDIYFNLGFIYSRLKQYAPAAENYEKVLSLDPNDKEALFNLSRVYENLSDPVKAKYYSDLYLKQGKK